MIIVYSLVSLLILELIVLVALLYFARFPAFLAIFTQSLKLLSPLFFGLSGMILILSLFSKGRELIARIWTTYLREFLKLLTISLFFTSVLLLTSILLGTFIVILLKLISRLPHVQSTMDSLQSWVARNCK